MASTKVSFPKYRLHKGSGQAFIQIKGKRHYLGVFDTQESKEAYSRFLAEMVSKSTPIPQSTHCADELTVVEICAAYLDYAPVYYQKGGIPTRQVDHIKLAIRAILQLYGTVRAVEFGPRALKDLQQAMIGRGWTRNYINA